MRKRSIPRAVDKSASVYSARTSMLPKPFDRARFAIVLLMKGVCWYSWSSRLAKAHSGWTGQLKLTVMQWCFHMRRPTLSKRFVVLAPMK